MRVGLRAAGVDGLQLRLVDVSAVDVGPRVGAGQRAYDRTEVEPRHERLEAVDRDALDRRARRLVALHEAVVVAVGEVRRDRRGASSEADRRERLLRAIHQARPSGPVREIALRLVRVPERSRVGRLVSEVLHAGVDRLGSLAEPVAQRERGVGYRAALVVGASDAAVGRERRAALEQLAHPYVLVVLLVVGVVAGRQREVHAGSRAARLRDRARGRESVDLPDRRVDRVRAERLHRAPGARSERVGELDARRRLLVGELEVAQLGEVGQRGAPRFPARLRLPGHQLAHHASPAGSLLERQESRLRGVERTARHDRPFHRREALRRNRRRRRRHGDRRPDGERQDLSSDRDAHVSSPEPPDASSVTGPSLNRIGEGS